MTRDYKGWDLYKATGVFAGSQNYYAKRFGVSIRANSEELLKQMIDNRPEFKYVEMWPSKELIKI